MKTLKTIIISIFLLLSIYVAIFNLQLRAVEKVCSSLTIGSTMPPIDELKEKMFLTMMGPSDNQNGNQHLVMCSTLSMCENACAIEYDQETIINVQHRDF